MAGAVAHGGGYYGTSPSSSFSSSCPDMSTHSILRGPQGSSLLNSPTKSKSSSTQYAEPTSTSVGNSAASASKTGVGKSHGVENWNQILSALTRTSTSCAFHFEPQCSTAHPSQSRRVSSGGDAMIPLKSCVSFRALDVVAGDPSGIDACFPDRIMAEAAVFEPRNVKSTGRLFEKLGVLLGVSDCRC